MTRPPFTVITVYNRYLNRGGEDVVFESEADLLEQNGCYVIRVEAQSRKPEHIIDATGMAISSVWSQRWYRKFLDLVEENKPDIIHIHNFWPNISPSAIYAAQRARVPVVLTLHNFRLICPATILYRNGKICKDCVGKSLPWPAIFHGCYQGMRSASCVLATMLTFHRAIDTWSKKISRYIALTRFSKDEFVRGGLPAARISVKPNFVEDRRSGAVEGAPREGALFVGRLSPEKGVHTLLEAWSSLDMPLRVAGDGPLLDRVRTTAAPHIVSMGRKPPGEVAAEMARAVFLVMPSEGYETFGMTIIEAFCHGLPVIASRLGAMAEIVEDGVTGLHFAAGDPQDLAAKVRWASAHPEEMRRMGENARRVYEDLYTPEVNYRQLMAIYDEAAPLQ